MGALRARTASVVDPYDQLSHSQVVFHIGVCRLNMIKRICVAGNRQPPRRYIVHKFLKHLAREIVAVASIRCQPDAGRDAGIRVELFNNPPIAKHADETNSPMNPDRVQGVRQRRNAHKLERGVDSVGEDRTHGGRNEAVVQRVRREWEAREYAGLPPVQGRRGRRRALCFSSDLLTTG